MENKFKAGEYIVYDTYGICEIQEIKKMSLVQGTPFQPYYVLKPLSAGQSTYYVPCENETLCLRMRRPMIKSEIEELLSKSVTSNVKWIENRQLRSEKAREIIKNGVSPDLIALIRCLYERKLSLKESGKTLSSTNENLLSAYEKLINEELSFCLNIPASEVAGYIKDCIKA